MSLAYFAFAEFESDNSALISPTNDSWDNDGNINFSCSFNVIGDNDNITKVELYINTTEPWVISETNSTDMSPAGVYTYYFSPTTFPDGVYVWNCLATDNATNEFWASPSNNYTIKVDSTAPTVLNVSSTKADGSYKAGEEINVIITFSEAVTVATATPSIWLELGTTDRNVSYASGSGTTALTFAYTVQSGDTSSDLDYTNTSALFLNGATIKDAAGNNAKLDLAAPGAPNSLGSNTVLVIDTIAPTVNMVNSNFNTTSTTPSVTFNYTDALSSTASCVLYFNDTALDTSLTVANNTNIVLTVNTSQSEGTYSVYVSCADLAGNIENSSGIAVIIDTTAPTATVALSDPTPVKAGNVTFTLDFGEAMDQTQAPTVKLNNSNVEAIGWQSSTQWTGWYNFSNETEGNYTINVTAAKDIAGNTMAEDTSNWFVLDTTAPSVTVSSSAGTSTTASTTTIFGNATDSGSGIVNVTVDGGNDTNLNTTTGAYSKSVELTLGSNVIPVIAYDNAGNSFTTSITVTRTAVTTSGGSSSSSGGSVSYTPVSEKGTSITLRKGFIKTFTLNGKYHTIKGIKIEPDNATFQVTSTPVTITLKPLEFKKLDFNNDNYYDLYIKLDEINNSKAYLTLKHINESITAETEEQPEEVPEETPEEPEEITGEEPESTEEKSEDKAKTTEEETEVKKFPTAEIIIVILIVFFIGLMGYIIYSKKKTY
jgi:hypothetical protein